MSIIQTPQVFFADREWPFKPSLHPAPKLYPSIFYPPQIFLSIQFFPHVKFWQKNLSPGVNFINTKCQHFKSQNMAFKCQKWRLTFRELHKTFLALSGLCWSWLNLKDITFIGHKASLSTKHMRIELNKLSTIFSW